MRVRALNAVPLRLRDRSGSYCRWIDGRSCYGAFCEVQCPLTDMSIEVVTGPSVKYSVRTEALTNMSIL